jgi:hypothetical protein
MRCFEQTASPAELEACHRSAERFLNAKCKYCGAPAVGGSTALSIPGVMAAESDFWCESCRLDLVEFANRPENAIPDFDVEDEARLDEISQQLAERNRRQAEFMRERVKKRSR